MERRRLVHADVVRSARKSSELWTSWRSLAFSAACRFAAIGLISAGLGQALPGTLSAQPGPQAREDRKCPSGRRFAAVVASLRDARTVVLDDGSVFTLKGILPPRASDSPGTVDGQWPIADEAESEIRSLLLGAQVEVSIAGKRDRYGRRDVHLFLSRDGDEPEWLQKRLLENGLARFDPESLRTRCAQILSAAERQARRSRRGLWKLAAYRHRSALQEGQLLRLQSTFQLVEGKIVSAKSVRGRVFLNFGKDWRNDFTAGIRKSQMRYFERLQLDPLELEGRNVIVRGWIERYGGPYIEIRHTHQIEVIGGWRQRKERPDATEAEEQRAAPDIAAVPARS